MTSITSYSSNYYLNNTTQVAAIALSFYNTSAFQSVTYDNGNNMKYTQSFIIITLRNVL